MVICSLSSGQHSAFGINTRGRGTHKEYGSESRKHSSLRASIDWALDFQGIRKRQLKLLIFLTIERRAHGDVEKISGMIVFLMTIYGICIFSTLTLVRSLPLPTLQPPKVTTHSAPEFIAESNSIQPNPPLSNQTPNPSTLPNRAIEPTPSTHWLGPPRLSATPTCPPFPNGQFQLDTSLTAPIRPTYQARTFTPPLIPHLPA